MFSTTSQAYLSPLLSRKGTVMPPKSALYNVLRATTLDELRAASPHDAVVIGAGAAGGLAAMLLAESGLRVLVLDAGPAFFSVARSCAQINGRLGSKAFGAWMFRSFAPRSYSQGKRTGQNTRPMASAGPITVLCVGSGANCLRGRSRLSICHAAGSSFRLDSRAEIGWASRCSRSRPPVLSPGTRRFCSLRWIEHFLAVAT